MFILTCNLFGMIPYGFTVTSHISITFALAMMIFILVTCLVLPYMVYVFSTLFLPTGTPGWLAPLMIIIELFAYLARPVKLYRCVLLPIWWLDMFYLKSWLVLWSVQWLYILENNTGTIYSNIDWF